MKISEAWLREWVNPSLTTEALCKALTMSGFEVESADPVAASFTSVVVGQVKTVVKHPQADKLNLCEVDAGQSALLKIVCGAENVRPGIKVPVALIGAQLPNDLTIKAAKIRGEDSSGMLCSALELGLAEESHGLLILPDDAPLGKNIREYLQLDDVTIDISITPNRGDCLSARGMSREVGAITNTAVQAVKIIEAVKKSRDVIPVTVSDTAGCPHYVGRIIRHVKADADTPMWMKERLRRSGLRSIHFIVDVTNYVMLELGQPMHAFDLQKIQQGIDVRVSKNGETIELLDGTKVKLDDKTLVIADHESPLAIAGVMGGLTSGVTLTTQDIFLESAFFTPSVVAKQRQFYQLNSDSAYRFERGVDPAIQKIAMERATALIVEIAGGEAGPLIEVCTHETLPKKREIRLSDDRIAQLLGYAVPSVEVKRILTALGLSCKREADKWSVMPPTWRFDISIPEDIIEEIARLYGFDKIPMTPMNGDLCLTVPVKEAEAYLPIRQTFADLGFHEVISYSFIDKNLQTLLAPGQPFRELTNPITAEMSVMRTTLWAGLLQTLIYNTSRQQQRVKLFEIGSCFHPETKGMRQSMRFAGVIAGTAYPYQWGVTERTADFYDLKGAIDNLFIRVFPNAVMSYQPAEHPALHPGQTAEIFLNGSKIGIIGALHPLVLQNLDVKEAVFVFDIDLSALPETTKNPSRDISRFPEIRRDLAILVNQTIPAAQIQDTIKGSAGDWLKECFIFDVYQGKGIAPGLKSVALGMILQHPTRTLVDEEVVQLTDRVVQALKGQLGAELRS